MAVATNDVHCQIDQKKNKDEIVTNIGYAGVLAYKKEIDWSIPNL